MAIVEDQDITNILHYLNPNQRIKKNSAYIKEDCCIGCNKCAKLCPAKAIVGSMRTVHTVMSKNCISCDICIESCPVNCIKIIPVDITINNLQSNKEDVSISLNLIYNHK
ncbi:RnfABCDGE type electron transport complex subunit B [Candidatus Pantoea edessiphila]|uniref:4Fe-4S ferredoxin-type domain-containing protein n=1 Tax=Candidatus Pantoea edessiphila TaxID=2044610 RepID=A0A2P5SWT3_9GAMM|nr:RnfABCDGE type electron transport complex subunit B [Candidatus Pantoea edessiphila]PPI86795.1 hypothetical protein CRV10_00875 [Candidatus Pantoea edessiphila]